MSLLRRAHLVEPAVPAHVLVDPGVDHRDHDLVLRQRQGHLLLGERIHGDRGRSGSVCGLDDHVQGGDHRGRGGHAAAREKVDGVVDRDAGLLIVTVLERVHPDEVVQRVATWVVRRESTSHEAAVA